MITRNKFEDRLYILIFIFFIEYTEELQIFVLRRRIEFFIQRELTRHTSAYITRLKQQQQKTSAEV